MKNILKTVFSVKNSQDKSHKIITFLGVKVKFKKKELIKNVYVGCGDDFKEGYVGCDIRKTKNTKIVCKAWELSKKVKDLENIYSRHMCEHLTYDEFIFTLTDWYKTLKPAGLVHIIVPNIDYHIEQFKRAEFDNKSLETKWSDLSWSLAGFCGWQRENYIKIKNDTKYWDVHKSVWNSKLIRLFLENLGYVHITCEVIDNVHLSVMARKPIPHDYSINSGERQFAETIDGIRKDHIERYTLAINKIKEYIDNKNTIYGLDVFCGNGYGSFMLSQNIDTELDSFDGSEEAIQQANKCYKSNNITFEHKLFPFEFEKNKYEYIVSLESIEHIKQYRDFLSQLTNALKSNGILIISTPNQNKNNLIKNYNPFHYRHYTNNEALELFEAYGFELIEIYGQDCYVINDDGCIIDSLKPEEMGIRKDYEGQFTIFVLRKKGN